MNMLLALLAVRSFVVVTPETPTDAGAAAQFDDRVRRLVREHRDETFRILDLGRFLRGKSAAHVAPRKEAAALLEEARRSYSELDVEGAVTKLREALSKVEAGLASRKGTPTWLSIRIELGLRLWELEDPRGVALVAKSLAIAPKHALPPGSQLSDKMSEQVAKMRHAKPAPQVVHFEASSPMLIQIAEHSCVTPCSIEGLPEGSIPWRATAPGFEAIGGVSAAGSTQRLTAVPIAGLAALLTRLKPLWRLPGSGADRLLATLKTKLPAPHLIWFQVGEGRLAMLRGQVVPKAALFYRDTRATKVQMDDAELLAWLKEAMAESAEVGAPVEPGGLLHRMGTWWSKHGPTMPKLSMPSVSGRTVLLSGVTVAGSAAIAGLAYYLSQRPAPNRPYDPVLGF